MFYETIFPTRTTSCLSKLTIMWESPLVIRFIANRKTLSI
uniref:Uncharacterized protein n=1 Tax=Anopheles albimanus TaxID=7167 RepID=A0A182FXA8_ANOAL